MNQSKNTPQKEPLKFRFDISAYKLLGRELITDRITALFELVKNSYDANADNVWVEFQNVNPISDKSKIVIRDDGIGMTYEDLRDKWMVIGANNKRTKKYSPAPYNRKFVGEKGVGRFAVDKLGSKLTLRTKKKNTSEVNVLTIDWTEYEREAESQVRSDQQNGIEDRLKFTDIENVIVTEVQEDNKQGTTLEITAIRDVWDDLDIERAYSELAKIVSPLKKLINPFRIHLQSDQHEKYLKSQEVLNNAIQYATEEFHLKYNYESKKQEVLTIKEKKLGKKLVQFYDMGPIKFKLYYFDQPSKRKYKNEYKGASIDGIKIYRDDLITTPFAEYATSDLKKRDILGIDKRRYSGFFDKVSSKDIIGIVEITKELNPNITDSTNRQDFVDNEAYRELKDFIIRQLRVFEQYLKLKKEEHKQHIIRELDTADKEIRNLKSIVDDIKKKSHPSLKPLLDQLLGITAQLKDKLDRGSKALKESEKDRVRQENLFLSLMSLQNYATQIAHVVRTAIQHIGSKANFFARRFPDESLNDVFIKYAKKIDEGIVNLEKAVNHMLSYASSNTKFDDIDLKELIENLFYDTYEQNFKDERIQTTVEIDKNIIVTHNRKFLEDIFQNLISNSIKALKNQNNKKIKCTGIIRQNHFELYFSDNGCGIAIEDRERIFGVYYTKTADDGGAGVGLYIVKERIRALKGSIEVIEPLLKPNGATFKIVIPFKK